MLDRDLIRLSQSHLNLLELCPAKFQQVYVDCLGSLPIPELQDSMEWGSRFHLLMQQRELTLPIEPFLNTDTEMSRALKDLIEAAPELKPASDVWREAEHYRTLAIDNFLFTVVYDLSIAQSDRATIFDWKTYRQPPKTKNLENNWQTRLYLYVLAETTEYEPEQLQMVYWFVKSGKPSRRTIAYSRQQHCQTEQKLTALLASLTTWLQNYQQLNIDFPHKPDCEKCSFYQELVPAEMRANTQQALFNAIDEIEEIPI